MKPFRPLTIEQITPPRPLRESLATMPSREATSPWTPRKAETPPDSGLSAMTLVSPEQLEAQARERGRAEGLAETAALRKRLSATLSQLEMACAEMHALASTQIADAVVAVIATWTGHASRAELFEPVIRGWLSTTATGATPRVHVHPGDVDAAKAAIADAALTVVPDPSIKPGDMSIRGETLELVQRWDERLADLREQVAVWLDHEAGTP
jgi:flagellar biosynthesis/type III secretory pathway protein FliH